MATATQRSKARYRRAHFVLSSIALDREHWRALDKLMAARKCGKAELVRSLLLEASQSLGPNPVDEPSE